MPLLLHEHLLCGLLAVGSHLHDVHALGKIGVLHLRTSEVVHLQAVVLAANVHLSVAYEDANTLLSLGAVHVGRLDEARLLVRLAQTRLAAVVDSVLVVVLVELAYVSHDAHVLQHSLDVVLSLVGIIARVDALGYGDGFLPRKQLTRFYVLHQESPCVARHRSAEGAVVYVVVSAARLTRFDAVLHEVYVEDRAVVRHGLVRQHIELHVQFACALVQCGLEVERNVRLLGVGVVDGGKQAVDVGGVHYRRSAYVGVSVAVDHSRRCECARRVRVEEYVCRVFAHLGDRCTVELLGEENVHLLVGDILAAQHELGEVDGLALQSLQLGVAQAHSLSLLLCAAEAEYVVARNLIFRVADVGGVDVPCYKEKGSDAK